jgi:hypothetical protein
MWGGCEPFMKRRRRNGGQQAKLNPDFLVLLVRYGDNGQVFIG